MRFDDDKAWKSKITLAVNIVEVTLIKRSWLTPGFVFGRLAQQCHETSKIFTGTEWIFAWLAEEKVTFGFLGLVSSATQKNIISRKLTKAGLSSFMVSRREEVNLISLISAHILWCEGSGRFCKTWQPTTPKSWTC